MSNLKHLCELNGIMLSDEVYRKLDTFKNLLIKWGKRINLTSIMSPNEIGVKHFLDSLLGLKVIKGFKHGRIVDVGSGAGFPGIPLALAMEDSWFDLVESRFKRCAFLEEVKRKLGLQNVNVLCRNVLDVNNSYDIILMRAFKRFDEALKLVSHLMNQNNVLIIYRSKRLPQLNELKLNVYNVDLDVKGLNLRRGFTIISKGGKVGYLGLAG